MRNLLLLDPQNTFGEHFSGHHEARKPKHRPKRRFLQNFRSRRRESGDGDLEMQPLSARIEPSLYPLIKRTPARTFRGDMYKAAGIKPAELEIIDRSALAGSLYDINDRDLTLGPFCLALTDDPRRHLRFDETQDKPTIQILSTEAVCTLALLDITGMMEYPTFHIQNAN